MSAQSFSPNWHIHRIDRESAGQQLMFAGSYLDVSFDLCTPAYCFFVDDALC